METNVKFDCLGYTVIADGLVLSPGHVEDVQLDIEGMDISEVPAVDFKVIKETAREELINSVYDSELSFD